MAEDKAARPPNGNRPGEAAEYRGVTTDVVVPLAVATIAGPGSVATDVVLNHVFNRKPKDEGSKIELPPGVDRD